jgi:hypothetical protein
MGLAIAVVHIGLGHGRHRRPWASEDKAASPACHNFGAVVLGKLRSIGEPVAVLLSLSALMKALKDPLLGLEIGG